MTNEQYVVLTSAAVADYLKACEEAGETDKQLALTALQNRVNFERMKAATTRTQN